MADMVLIALMMHGSVDRQHVHSQVLTWKSARSSATNNYRFLRVVAGCYPCEFVRVSMSDRNMVPYRAHVA